ncbi:hypothetical protein ACFFRR_006008 [Megaselia abdita]
MALFEFKWLRRQVRKHTRPIPFNTADRWKRRLSLGYAIVAWQAFGVVCYLFYTGRGDWAKTQGLKSEEELMMSPAQQFSMTLNVEKGKIVRIKNFSKVDEKEFDNTIPKDQ